jgi:prepilin-type N-terminal cleavage/methylation domain-containing protein
MRRALTSSNLTSSRQRGFTLLEILIAMAIFAMLGSMIVVFLRQSLDIFYVGTRESQQLDRQDSVLPQVRADFASIALPASFQAPAPPPSQDELDRRGSVKPPPPGAVLQRLRAGFVKLKQVGGTTFKDFPVYYIACVVADANEGADRLRRRAGEVPAKGNDLKDLTPKTVIEGDKDTRYKATGGHTEVLWIAVPAAVMRAAGEVGPDYPAILTLYRGFRSPIGTPGKSLLMPENFDTPAEIKAACRPIAEGLLHFGARWRRVFAKSWELNLAIGYGERAPYVGPVWDSTRALEQSWSLHKGPDSLGDPSDDIFPPFVRLEATLAINSPFGPGRGEFSLREGCSADETMLNVGNTDLLLQPSLGKDRWMKVDNEWMHYEVRDVDYAKGRIRVRRAMRGTKKVAHDASAWCYVGTPATLEMRLPVFHDGFVVREGNRR